MINSEDYKLLSLPKYVITNDDGEIVNTLEFNSTDISKIPKIKFKDLREKLNNITLDYETLFNYYSLIIGKTNFMKTNMSNFNLKEVNLECKKDKYTIKVKELLKKNYKNFEDLVKNNSRFKKFIEVYSSENTTKKQQISDIQINRPNYHKEFYWNCTNFIADIKSFLEYTITK